MRAGAVPPRSYRLACPRHGRRNVLIEDTKAKLTAHRLRSWRPNWKKGDGFDLNDFPGTAKTDENMGGMASLMGNTTRM